MSWSYGAIQEKGLILREEDFKNLLKLNKKFKEEEELTDEDINEMNGGDLQNVFYDMGMYACYVTVCDLYKLIGFNENGEGQYDLIETIEDGSIYVIYLKKDNLLNSYKDYNEILEEVLNSIVDCFKIDVETLYKELGKDFITDRIGLATGFYSDR